MAIATLFGRQFNFQCSQGNEIAIGRLLTSIDTTMDTLQQCLSLAPVPYLAPAFSALRFIWTSVQHAQASKRQLVALAQSIAQLLQMLDRVFRWTPVEGQDNNASR
jgi:hypothetical protein